MLQGFYGILLLIEKSPEYPRLWITNFESSPWKVSVASLEVVKRYPVKIYEIRPTKTILDLGLRHVEQISLLTKVQNALLAEQSALIDLGYDACPNCGQKLKKNGFMQSNFHAV